MEAVNYSFSTVSEDAITLERPIFCIFELTTKCNWRCKHCYLPNHNGLFLQYSDFEKIFAELREFGIHQVAFTGGELFMRKDALDIIKLARKNYFRVNILSNASLLTEEIVQELKNIFITDYSLTIFSLNPEIHDGITGVKGSLNQALKGVELLQKYGISIEIKSPLLKDNKDSFVEVFEFCKENGIKFLSSACIFPKLNGDITPLNFSLEGEELKEAVKKSDDIMNYSKRIYLTKNMCDLLITGFAINFKGDLYPCNSFFKKMGNVREESIQEIWNKEMYKEIRHLSNLNLKKCYECKLLPYCDRCPATLYAEGKNYEDCSEIAKGIAVARWENNERG